MTVLGIIVIIFYFSLIGSFVYGFYKVPYFKFENIDPETEFSIIIPFRNEEKNLPLLLESIAALNYPKHLFEIILVNDDSDDNSVEIINKTLYFEKEKSNSINIKVIENKRKTNAPKKDAITTAIATAKHNWIITTDADCELPKYWLDSFNAFIKKTATKCIVAPVTYKEEHSFLNQFQLLDFLSLQGSTIGTFGIKAPFMCNGANFAYQKSVFTEVDGFDKNTTIASGDDVFLLQKIAKKHHNAVHYLKCNRSIVITNAQPTWRDLISQRLRWASKASAYNNPFSKLVGIAVLATNAFIFISFLFSFTRFNIYMWLLLFLFKLSIDFLLLRKTALFFNQVINFITFFICSLLYPIFILYVTALSLFTKFNWKGRHFNK